jgi:16S rRNA G966 N2-methylase RsmD
MAKKKHNPGQGTFGSLKGEKVMPDGYYNGDQPNPHLRRFFDAHATPYDPESDDYAVRAFSQAITTTKATAIYNMHSYHQGKKPHDAIRQYIRHFTSPGDIVLDPFSGSGGTSLAALLENRRAVTVDRSPAATFVTKNYCTAVNPQHYQQAFLKLESAVRAEVEQLYETCCDRCGKTATTAFTVYSQVFQCQRCLIKIPLFDCVEATASTAAGKPKNVMTCPVCHKNKHYEEIGTGGERLGAVPVLSSYICTNGCSPARGERRHNDADLKKRQYFQKYDLAKIEDIERKTLPYAVPPHKMMNVEDDTQPWGHNWRPGRNFRNITDLFTKRNLWAIAAYLDHARRLPLSDELRDFLLFTITGAILNASKLYRHRDSGGGGSTGTYYIGNINREMSMRDLIQSKQSDVYSGLRELEGLSSDVIISTQSSQNLSAIPSNSVDYIFTDPPYSDKVQYGELNFIWEAWLGFDTKWHDEEIIVNPVRGKTEEDWAAMMKQAVAECYRVLKPGRWLSLCYHDTSEGTWGLVQDIMAEVGFVVEKTDTALFIDTGQKSSNQVTADKSTKRDLVLNFRKPKPLPFKVTRVYGPEDAKNLPDGGDIATFAEFAKQIVRDFLTRRPGATKDRIYDELVNRLVSSRSMEAHDFDALLKSVAEEVQQPVKVDLFRNKEPDLLGSHVQSRWYLKETADQVDHAEQSKEDDAAKRIERFIGEYLKKKPELEGVHYSDLFEQYLPVHDKPRRLLADWLPEYFIKTASGTWRLPDTEEGQVLAKLREAGTLRRIKRFANTLIDGVPVREKDRPGSDVDMLDWLRQCRRAGLYEQGRAIYEKGGLNSASLTDEQQIEAEDDYRICVRRGSEEEAKPKRKTLKKQNDDE